ncbi:hypothetical protein LXL04_023836 [Taraxacum kok-saghyz]
MDEGFDDDGFLEYVEEEKKGVGLMPANFQSIYWRKISKKMSLDRQSREELVYSYQELIDRLNTGKQSQQPEEHPNTVNLLQQPKEHPNPEIVESIPEDEQLPLEEIVEPEENQSARADELVNPAGEPVHITSFNPRTAVIVQSFVDVLSERSFKTANDYYTANLPHRQEDVIRVPVAPSSRAEHASVWVGFDLKPNPNRQCSVSQNFKPKPKPKPMGSVSRSEWCKLVPVHPAFHGLVNLQQQPEEHPNHVNLLKQPEEHSNPEFEELIPKDEQPPLKEIVEPEENQSMRADEVVNPAGEHVHIASFNPRTAVIPEEHPNPVNLLQQPEEHPNPEIVELIPEDGQPPLEEIVEPEENQSARADELVNPTGETVHIASFNPRTAVIVQSFVDVLYERTFKTANDNYTANLPRRQEDVIRVPFAPSSRVEHASVWVGLNLKPNPNRQGSVSQNFKPKPKPKPMGSVSRF